MTSRRALRWGAVSFAATALGASSSGCELIAGTRDRTMAMAGDSGSSASAGVGGTDAGAGGTGAGAGGAGAGGASAGSAGGGGAGGGGPTTHPWPDSATQFCAVSGMATPCPVSITSNFRGQDGDFLIHPPTYETSGNSTERTITDKVTGLVWQGDFSTVIGQDISWGDAKSSCEVRTEAGMDDWRLPTRRELASLLDTGHAQTQGGLAPIFPSVFDDLITDGQVGGAFYWVDTEAQGAPNYAWGFSLLPYNFTTDRILKTTRLGGRALCVRGPDVYQGTKLDIDGNVVRDDNTGLVWQRDRALFQLTWTQALSYCDDLSQGGVTDFRLPTLKELLYLVEDTQVSPAIDHEAFPSTPQSTFWTSTPYAGIPSKIFIVDFNSGEASTGDYQTTQYVRCVR